MGPREDPLDVIDGVVSAMVELLFPAVEAVLHDVRRDRIARIWNPYSGRKAGGPSLLDAAALAGVDQGAVMGPYDQVGVDGRPETSVSVPLLGGRYLLCMNFDRTPIVQVIEALQRIAAPSQPQPAPLFDRDWQSGINQVVDDWCRERHRSRQALDRNDRVAIVALLDEKGLFATRHAVAHVAQALAVSRAGVYTLRKAARDPGGAVTSPTES